MLHAQGELSLGDLKLTSLSFDLCYLINCSFFLGGGGHLKKNYRFKGGGACKKNWQAGGGVMQFLNGASRIPPAPPPHPSLVKNEQSLNKKNYCAGALI